ncbi:MAG: hypothetical protein E5X84_35960, partial [Mesorhizobium sp.]
MSATTDRSWTSIWAAPDAAVRALAGLSVLPDFLVRDDLAAGRLAQILPEWRLPSGGIYTVYPAARFRAPKMTRFVEMLVAAEQKVASRRAGAGAVSLREALMAETLEVPRPKLPISPLEGPLRGEMAGRPEG